MTGWEMFFEIFYDVIAVIAGCCIVHCTMWTWETDLSFSEMKWYQKGKVIAAKVTLWAVAAFLVYVFAVIIKMLMWWRS